MEGAAHCRPSVAGFNDGMSALPGREPYAVPMMLYFKPPQARGQALRMDGTPVEIGRSEGGGACGVWVEANGAPVIEMAEAAPSAQ